MKGIKYSIEPMQVKHLEEVLAIEKVSFPTPWSRHAFWSELCQNEFAHYFVCTVEGKVAGYAGMWVILDEAHVTTLAVAPEFRGRKLSRALLAELVRQATCLGANYITLEVRPSNYPARKLYGSMGFEATGIRKGYYTDNQEDAIIMTKNLR
ncbi:ribosomal protein S18-alanine N-acetyltransferase [Calderihabitans maritimus]|uniref:[Ribosomal protein bS18]-alanine N-acetyltransferase n=1 Tax=Calderihabitans maritimus TaxID=1246530 RepID=A0A1Z5HTB4_9FIRM|nr:ribosomal protein S18-alanine N-acetyltransferase [Calderihabitans maritimus]GAW92510.1 ribosomal-protein-alanine acetyltransferase [Calderihabitans maritimus]